MFVRVNYKYDFTGRRVFGKMVLMALPLIGIALLNWLDSLLGTTTIGRFIGSYALAAYSSTNTILLIPNAIVAALGMAAAIAGAHAYGTHEPERLSGTVHMTMFVAFITGINLTLLTLVLASPATFMALSYPEEIIGYGVSYARIIALSYFAETLFSAAIGLMYSVGDTVRPLMLTLIKFITGVVLKFVFMFVLGMGLQGVAMASLISATLAAALAFVVLCISRGCIRFTFRRLFRFDWRPLVFVLIATTAAALGSLAAAVPQYISSANLAAYGVMMVAAYSLASNISGFVTAVTAPFAAVVYVAVGQAAGARSSRLAIRNSALSLALFAMPVLHTALVVFMFASPLVYMMSSDAELVHMARGMSTVMILTAVISAFTTAFGAMIRARGWNFTAALLTSGVLALVTIATLTRTFIYGESLSVMGLVTSELGCAALTLLSAAAGVVLVSLVMHLILRRKNAAV